MSNLPHCNCPYYSHAGSTQKENENGRLICLTAIAHITVMQAVHRKKMKTTDV